MWKRGLAAGAVLGAVAVAAVGCGGQGGGPAASTTSPAAQIAAPASFAACGSMSNTDVAEATGLATLRLVAANPFRCTWESPGGDFGVVFEWFRGSSLQDRRTQVTLGPAQSTRVSGHAAISWTGNNGCELAVDSGGGDFIDWDVIGGAGHTACSGLPTLAANTLAKAG